MAKLREQERAQKAFLLVNKRKDNAPKEYRPELRQLPSRILSVGLGQTLAFYASKGGIHDEIGGYLAQFLIGKSNTLDLLNDIMNGNASQYRAYTREALAFAEWLKRYGSALIEDKSTK